MAKLIKFLLQWSLLIVIIFRHLVVNFANFSLCACCHNDTNGLPGSYIGALCIKHLQTGCGQVIVKTDCCPHQGMHMPPSHCKVMHIPPQMDVQTHTHQCVHMYMLTHVHTYTHTRTHTLYTRTHTLYTRTCTHMRTRTHTHAHTHITDSLRRACLSCLG